MTLTAGDRVVISPLLCLLMCFKKYVKAVEITICSQFTNNVSPTCATQCLFQSYSIALKLSVFSVENFLKKKWL